MTAACLPALLLPMVNVQAQNPDDEVLDAISVTATRSERPTKEVPAAISVIGKEKLETSRMFNITDALNETPGVLINSKQGGYDARLFIRGAGVKANFGIREVTVIRDGVPITDPDSFTRLDFVDTQDIEQIEVTKGPGNLYAAGSAGGTIQILSKSVFDHDSNGIKLGYGRFSTANLNLRYSDDITEDQAAAITVSRRQTDNHWRRNNRFDSSQVSLKHGIFLGNDTVWESELSYTDANIQFAGDLSEAQFEEYKDTGRQTDNNSAFKNTGRFSDILFFNTRLEFPWMGYTVKPRIYYNTYKQFHPVTGQIVETPGSDIYGIDVEAGRGHQLFGLNADFNAGITYRLDKDDDSKRFAYADVQTIPFGPQAGRIIATLSDRKGALIEEKDTTNRLYGFFVQESIKLNKDLTFDIGTRLDRASLRQDINEIQRFDFARGQYVAGAGRFTVDKEFTLASPQTGLSYALTQQFNTYISLAQADQIPFSNELENNPNLDKSRVRNVEVGLKGRARNWSLDLALFWAQGEDEIVATLQNGETLFSNAGETDKQGLEFAGNVEVLDGVKVGMSYAYSRFKYDAFTEVVNGVAQDRGGNQLPFVPRHKYSFFADYRHGSGLTARISTDSWGRYYLDNANSETFEGYDFITDVFIGYEFDRHRIGLNINNLFDRRYAIQAKKDTRGNKSFVPGTPRNVLVSYRYEFK